MKTPVGDLNMMSAVVLWCIILYYLLFAWILRLRSKTQSMVTSYEPPEGVSAALAAYFLHPGNSLLSLAVCLIALVQKGSIRLRPLEVEGYYVKPGDDNVQLHSYERKVRGRLSECPLSPEAIRDANDILGYELERQIASRYMSAHYLLLSLPFLVSLFVLTRLLSVYLAATGRVGVASLGLTCLLCYWAAISLKAFATKVNSWIPGHHGPALPLQVSDLKAAWVSLLVAAWYYATASFTRAWPLVLFAGFAMANNFGRTALRTPTKDGWELYDRLQGFKDFLSSVEADQINSLSTPTEMPKKIRENLAFALAFDLESSWGKQLQLFLTQRLVAGKGEAIFRRLPDAFFADKDRSIL